MRGFQGKEGLAIDHMCDIVVPGPSRCLLIGVYLLGRRGIEHCVILYEKRHCIGHSFIIS